MLVKFCKNKKVEQVLAIMLIITMTLANILFLSKSLISYAFEENLEIQGVDTQNENVKFDAFFNDEEGRNVHSIVFDATNGVQTMNLYIAVKRVGYLKDAYIEFRDETNSVNTNYEIIGDALNTTLVQNVNPNTKTLSLNYINNGTEAVLQLPIVYNFTELANINKLKQNSFVTLRGIYVDEEGKESEILKTTKINVGWNIETELNVEQSIIKYVPYTYNDQSGLILQVGIKAKQNREDKVLPVRATGINAKVPEINGILPEKINVTANSTMATNGNEVEFTEDNWTYDESEKTVKIVVSGYQENEMVWSGTGADEYFITYTYPSEVYQYALENEATLHCEADGKMLVYSNQGVIEKTALSSGDVTVNQRVGNIVTYSIDASEQEISKGKIYANYNSEEKVYDTEYNTTIKANISNNELVEEVYMNLPCDNFVNGENIYATKVNGVCYTKYKQLVINKNNMQKLLGENGYINIYDSNSNSCVINSETQDVEGNYIVDFGEGIGELVLQTSKPVADGILEIKASKIISKDLSYTKGQVQQVNNLKVNLEGYTKIVGNDALVVPVYDAIALTETSTNAKLEISNTTLTAMAENKNVEIKIAFNNNIETSDLYRKPVFSISLPKYIEDIEIVGGNILYTNGLEIDYVERKNTDNGIVLTIYTKGAEKEFSNGTFTNGTNIVLNTNIKVNKMTPNVSDKIKLTYTNENVTTYSKEENGYGVDSVDINFIAPEEMVTFNTVLTSSMETTSTEGNEQTAKLEILDSSKTATMKISILNKYSNVCNNIRILGRIPFEGNKEITTGNDLGTTFNTKLTSEINTNGINALVYYSENENATEALTDDTNMWTQAPTNLANVKSYLIVLPDYEMKVGETLEFAYNCEIPEKLEHNESAYGTYVVYFNSVSEYTSANTAEATKVGLTTGIGANIETSTKVIYQGSEIPSDRIVRECQYVTYKTTVSNTGTVDAEGVRLTNTIENATIEDAVDATISENQLNWNLGQIKAGENKTVEYTVKVGRIGIENTFTNDIKVTAENFEGTLEDQIIKEIAEAEVEVTMDINSAGTEYTNGIELQCIMNISNLTTGDLFNTVARMYIPEGLEYVQKESSHGYATTYDEQTRMLTIRVGIIPYDSSVGESIYVKTSIAPDVGRIETKNSILVTANGIDSYESNIKKININGPILSINLSSNITSGSYVREGTQVEFTLNVSNSGETEASGSIINVEIPKELYVVEAYYNKGEQKVNLASGKSDKYYTLVNLAKDESVSIKIVTKAKIYEDDKDEVAVKVSANVQVSNSELKSNEITYRIENVRDSQTPSTPSNPSNPTKPVEETYKITGTAWLDENEDGIKDSNEKLLEGINVILIDANTGIIVTDKTNGTIKQVKTLNDGTYTFTNLPKGKYIVVFEYDSSYYDITEYNKYGETEDVTSKVIQAKINKDGKLQIAGITDTIEISNSSKANMNIGLVVKPKFDLSLEKSISKIVVQNAKGTSSHDFTNTKLAKVEIPAKYLNGSKVYVEYKITVKNDGQVPGYASKIVDYMDKSFTFVESDNPSWSKGADGYLYSDSLAKTLLNPGDKKELTLVLLKTMTENNTGLVSNKAEICSSYNDLNIDDYDSIAGNNAQGEDDLDYADTIISIKTGKIALYITITLITITIIATGAYFINKKVLRGGRI